MTTRRARGACPRCTKDVALLGAARRPAMHRCLDGLPWPRTERPLDDRRPPARLEFTGAEHAMFAEILLTGPLDPRRYASCTEQLAAAAVHVQLAKLILEASSEIHQQWDQEAQSYEWAQCLAVRGPMDVTDEKSNQ